jgi:large subunit ribosomal protein L13
MTVIDATNLIMGRMATVVSKRALLGETIDIINVEKAVITGNRLSTLADYEHKRARGSEAKGPYFPKNPDDIVRRVIRGMLPYKQAKGLLAYKRVKCYMGIPAEFEKVKPETIKVADISKLGSSKYVSLGEIGKYLGGKR